MKKTLSLSLALFCLPLTALAFQSEVVPTDIQQPGTQPGEIGNLESPNKCDNCHGGYNKTVEPAFNWRGSMMGNAGRDPIFWATMAIAEQDFAGSGDLCIRCHSTGGWYGGRSTPTDGSGLALSDSDGVDCDTCHKMTNPDDSEHLGEMNAPFVANDGTEGYLGSGILSLWGGSEKLGPYSDPAARHQFAQSKFHRSVDFCGSCHDVSNAVVGDLAPGHGAQPLVADAVIASGVLGGPIEDKAAFNNPPYKYGVVERTFSEYKSSALPTTRVKDYPNLPIDLQGGALKAAYESATASGGNGDYADGDFRFFSCQTCHLRPVNAPGCNKKGAPVREDMPLHDMTGGNYWMGEAIIYQNNKDLLRLGGSMSALQIEATEAGMVRAMKQLSEAASMSLNGNTVRLVNQTGHKAITGYPEGRRMWLNIKWFDSAGVLIREDGEYGPIGVSVTNPADGSLVDVESIVDLHDHNTKIYEAHYGMTQEWAEGLLALHPASMPLSFDRFTGTVDMTLGDLAGSLPGTEAETFHFVLNNTVIKDNRIPPYGFDYDTAMVRNALPVPASQYGDPGPGGQYDYFDDFTLSPPAGATYADIQLLYQTTSWEYIQFLDLANTGASAFLADEGVNMLEAWLNTGMSAPYVMASTVWGDAPTPTVPSIYAADIATWSVSKKGSLIAESSTFGSGDKVAITVDVVDEGGSPISGAQVFFEVRDSSGGLATAIQGFTDAQGHATLLWKISQKQSPDAFVATITDILENSYLYDPAMGVSTVSFLVQ